MVMRVVGRASGYACSLLEWRHVYCNEMQQEQQQLTELKAKLGAENDAVREIENPETIKRREDIEGGYGGQEDLEDRYATTCGEH